MYKHNLFIDCLRCKINFYGSFTTRACTLAAVGHTKSIGISCPAKAFTISIIIVLKRICSSRFCIEIFGSGTSSTLMDLIVHTMTPSIFFNANFTIGPNATSLGFDCWGIFTTL